MNFSGRTLNAKNSTTIFATANSVTLLTREISSVGKSNLPMTPAHSVGNAHVGH